MEYTIKDMSKLSGQSGRTIRFYHEIGLLLPNRIKDNGYRIYTDRELNILQQILFYRELGFELSAIKDLLTSPNFDMKQALLCHIKHLTEKRNHLDQLISTAQNTILSMKGELEMSNEEKFRGFKENLIKENEEKYGKEIRERFGDEKIDKSNQAIMNMNEKEYTDVEALGTLINIKLKEAFTIGDVTSDCSKELYEMHKKWINAYWGYYDKDAHSALSDAYVDDERFKAFYDEVSPGCAEFLRDVIKEYTK